MILRDYQKEIATSANRLLFSYKIAYLVMQVRTGKTLTALYCAELYGAKDVLFVTKKKAISSIEQDFAAAGFGYNITVINYESLHKLDVKYDFVILDEAHCLGQFPQPSNRTENLKDICKGLPILYLSGTPTPESYSQIYHQFWVSSFSPFDEPTFYKWFKSYGIPKLKYLYNREITDYSSTKDEMVIDKINKYMISFTQQEAGFEAPVTEHIIKLPMSKNVRWAIDKLQKEKIFITKLGDKVLADTAVKEMNKVHQLCSGTVKCEPVDGKDKFIIVDDTKANYIRDNFKGKKIAIFYKFVAELTQLKWTFGDRLVTDPMEFNQAGNDAIFVSQVQSGREGINISTADCIIMYSIDFSAVSYWQSRARLQTKDRKSPADVYWLFTEGGIEQAIYQCVMNKKDFTLDHYKKIK